MLPPREDTRIQVGIAGLGSMGRNHLRNVLSRDDVVLSAVADPVDATLADALAAAGPDVRGYADPSDMLREEELDALIVAVPTTLHFKVALEALSKRVAVLVEKPIAASIVDGQQLVRAAQERGTLLQAGHIERFNPVIRALGERLRAGDLTRIHSIKTIRGGPMPERIRDVGVAIDLATHDIDIMIHLIGERPIRVSAERSRQVHTAHEDLLYGLLYFPSGNVGLLDVNWLTPEKQRRVVVLGSEGMFQADYLTQTLTFTRGAAELKPSYHGGYAAMFAGDTVEIPVDHAEPLRRELDAFFDSVRNGTPPVVTGADGLTALTVAKLLLSAADEGRSMTVPSPEQVAQ
jgi:UDP-N-acetylglucosamine 3-dehydrogenase